MKFQVVITKVQTLTESEAAGAGLPEGSSVEDGKPFLVATFKDLDSNEETALRSEAFDVDVYHKRNAERNFWDNLGQVLWKRFSPDTYPYIEKDGVITLKPT